MAASGSGDWIESWLEWTNGIPSPDIFRLWCGIACIAGALERRVWVETGGGRIYPNLYTLLVGRPGVGKSQAITRVHEAWMEIKEFFVAADNMTKPGLIDNLAAAKRVILLGPTNMVEFHSLLVASSEFGVLVPAHDLEFLNTLNHIYDNPKSYRETRRYMGNKQIDIINPQLNILAGSQPTYLASLLPEEAWGMGFTSRLILIYSNQILQQELFDVFAVTDEKKKPVIDGLVRCSKLLGAMEFDNEAKDAIIRWRNAGLPPVPEHSKLENYNSRRILHTFKLCMVSAASKGRSTIYLADFQRAQDWLLQAESLMPDVFRDMVLRSDTQIIQELHMFVWQIYSREKKEVHVSRLINFLSGRTPSEKVMRILEVSEKAGYITRMAGEETYRPRPKNQTGVE